MLVSVPRTRTRVQGTRVKDEGHARRLNPSRSWRESLGAKILKMIPRGRAVQRMVWAHSNPSAFRRVSRVRVSVVRVSVYVSIVCVSIVRVSVVRVSIYVSIYVSIVRVSVVRVRSVHAVPGSAYVSDCIFFGENIPKKIQSDIPSLRSGETRGWGQVRGFGAEGLRNPSWSGCARCVAQEGLRKWGCATQFRPSGGAACAQGCMACR